MDKNQIKVVNLINERVLEAIKDGVGNWAGSTHKVGVSSYIDKPRNYVTGYEYTGINKVLLPPGLYITFGQLMRLGGKLKKDKDGKYPKQYFVSQSWHKVWVKYTIRGDDGELKTCIKLKSIFDKEKPEYVEILMTWTQTKYGYDKIYNIEDCYDYKEVPQKKLLNTPYNNATPSKNRDKICDLFLEYYTKKQNIKVYLLVSGSTLSHYDIVDDSIHLKAINDFESANVFYEHYFHECSHSTGAKNRLNRVGITSRDKERTEDKYAEEEVIAELSAMYCLRKVGMLTNGQALSSTEYLKGWLAETKLQERLKTEPQALIKIFQAADKAQEYIFTK